MTSPFDPNNPEDFPICPDCGKRHEPLPDNITLSTHDLFKIQQTLNSILAFSQEKRIPLTVISGMIQAFHAEIMEELMESKREVMEQVLKEQSEPFIKQLQEFLKGSPDHGGFQKEAGRVESKTGSNASDSGNSSKGIDPAGTNKGGSGILH